ncbi:alpha/beta hydrolase fold domain-containing protein [Aquibacillus halophilus]|uniref:Alpha/beta hydrolase fold domain-containing protein n=1 Tax=Aquibacillus halophilus TaxID=930132 RepID=A0A6A8D6F5_9BACI|nr:alpha/beta hydrolase [Aquibacillus halophilus]MRH41158.1 alpha/beta hydrolase fold domain-containing protein [Aquibacillus halophilus]
MTLDPQAKLVLDQIKKANNPPKSELSPEKARKIAGTNHPLEKPEVGRVEDRTIPGPDGEIPVRIYTPHGQGPFPALIYFHGGGWVLGDLNSSDTSCRLLTNGVNCVVISVDYRLAPEHKFPAAVNDAYATTRWVADNASSIEVNPNCLAVGGDSAGGNLAAVVAMMARDKAGPILSYQLLIYPIVNYNFDSNSYHENATGYMLTRDSMIWYWNHYLHNKDEGNHPYASPLQADDLNSLPPTLVITAEYDPLRDEGEAYAKRLKEAGVPVVFTRYKGMIHGFFTMTETIDKAKEATQQAVTALKKAFSK